MLSRARLPDGYRYAIGDRPGAATACLVEPAAKEETFEDAIILCSWSRSSPPWRLWNTEVLTNLDSVLQSILEYIQSSSIKHLP